MKKLLLPILSLLISFQLGAQITVTQADYGQVGDNITVGNDNNPPAGLSVGSTGNQTWNFTSLSLSNINTLNFVNPSSTASGSQFPGADLAIERATDTLFFQSSTSAFVIDGVSGSGFGLPINIVADFSPNSTQIEFPATLNSSFVDTAVFDTIVDCASLGFGGTCDSARLKRVLVGSGDINAYGTISTPGGNFETVRQYFREDNTDSIWIKLPFLGWTLFSDSLSTNHNYRWMANGEKWPVLSAVADAPGGDIISAEFTIGAQVLAFADAVYGPSCNNGGCNGSISIFAIGGVAPYSYTWSNGQTSAIATGLCAGSYTVTIEDSDTSSYELTVTVNEPSAVAIAGSVQASNGNDGAIDITVSGGTGAGTYSYDWSGPDGYTASTADISNLAPGDYTVVVTDNNNCDTSRTFTVILTGLETIGQSGFKAYPNPANGELFLNSNQAILSYRVTDLLGNVVLVGSPKTSATVITTSQIAAGLYAIEVVTEQGTYMTKVTINH